MTQQDTLAARPPLNVAIDSLIHHHGSWRVLASSVTGLFRAALLTRQLDHMPEHLRRDIGLPPRDEPVRLRERTW